MKSKILSKHRKLVLALEIIVFFTALLLYCIPERPVQSGPITTIENAIITPKQEQANPGLPVRVKIPSIDVDADVEYVGLTADEAMDIPKNQDNVAWYKLGQRPGDNGSAVIAGHYGVWDNGRGLVFDNLSKLSKDDELYVVDDKGATTTFIVRESRSYDPKADASSVFVSNDGISHLNLIACEGSWDDVSKSYPKRLVVFTDKE